MNLETILKMSLLPFLGLEHGIALLSMVGQNALRFQQKHPNLSSKDEQRSSGLERHEGE